MVYNDKLNKEIPIGWEVKNLLEEVSWESNSQPPKSAFIYENKPGYIRFIQNRDYESNNHITYIPLTKNLSIASKFDILMDKYGDAGAVRYGIEGAFNVALGKITVKNPNMQEYVRSFFESNGVYNYLHNSCMASTRASLSESNLSMLFLVIPQDDVLIQFQKLIHKIRTLMLKNTEEKDSMIALRNWLLPMLMNGQVCIED